MYDYYRSDLIKSLAILYLFINVSELKQIFTCDENNFVNKYKILHYLIAFFCLYFLVTLVTQTKELKNVSPFQKLIYSLFYFILFVLTKRLDHRIRMIVIMFIFIYYYIDINKEYYFENKKNKNKYIIDLQEPYYIQWGKISESDLKYFNIILDIIYYLIIILIFFGFFTYRGELKYHFKKNYSIITDILKTNVCKPYNKKLSLWQYFRIGLNI